MKKEGSGKEICNNSYYENKIEINCVIFCFEDKKLKVLLVKNESDFKNFNWKLPGASLSECETMITTAKKIFKNYIFSDDFFLEQLKAFGFNYPLFPENISIGYYAMIRKEKQTLENQSLNSDIIWAEVKDVNYLDERDRVMLDFSLKELKKNICCSALGFKLLPQKFTLLQVVHLYEEILGIEINKVNFRRKILQRELVHALNEKEEGVSYRAAKFYSLNVSEQDMFWSTKFNFNF